MNIIPRRSQSDLERPIQILKIGVSNKVYEAGITGQMLGTIDKPKIAVIELIRGLAALSVGLFHFSTELSGPLPDLFHYFGWAGVDVFFVISGFVIPLSLVGTGYKVSDFPRFLARRLVRLEPPYLFSIALSILLLYASAATPGFRGPDPDVSATQVAFHLFYAVPLTSYKWLNPVYWTLAYEFVFYILVGLLFIPLMRAHAVWTIGLAFGISAIAVANYGELNHRVLEFLLGINIMRHVSRRDPAYITLLLCGIASVAIFWFGGPIAGASAIGCTLAIVAFIKQRVPSIFLWLGSISYSFYLTHAPVGARIVHLGKRFGEGDVYDCLILITALLASLAFAALFATLIERPAIQWSRRIVVSKAKNTPSDALT